jgi:hypothetical protein
MTALDALAIDAIVCLSFVKKKLGYFGPTTILGTTGGLGRTHQLQPPMSSDFTLFPTECSQIFLGEIWVLFYHLFTGSYKNISFPLLLCLSFFVGTELIIIVELQRSSV